MSQAVENSEAVLVFDMKATDVFIWKRSMLSLADQATVDHWTEVLSDHPHIESAQVFDPAGIRVTLLKISQHMALAYDVDDQAGVVLLRDIIFA